jgi:transglutaminase-like putative cysteine protease
MLLDIHHETVYRYAVPATYSMQYVRLFPRTDGGQRILHWTIDSPGRRWRQTDAYGNQVYSMSLTETHDEIRVVAYGQVETSDERGQLLPHDSNVPPLAFALQTPLTAADAQIEKLAGASLGEAHGMGVSSLETLKALMGAVFQRVSYKKGATDVTATAAEALAQGKGVCQDMAHVFIAACRARGIPARYVSGYLLTEDRDHTSSHAWAEAWVADAHRGNGAWLGFDITNNRLAGPELCRLAVGRDFMDAGPIRGTRLGGVDEKMHVRVAVAGQ